MNGRHIARSRGESEHSEPRWNVGFFYVPECFEPPPAAGVDARIVVQNTLNGNTLVDTAVTIPTDQVSPATVSYTACT